MFPVPESREQLTGSGGIHLSTGSYIIRVSGEQYLKYEERIEIEQGKTTHLIPKLEYSEEYQKELRIQDRKEAESYYTKELEDLEVRIGEGGDVRENALELKAVRELRSRIEQSRHDFPEFLEAADLMLMKILKIKVETLQKDYDQALIKRRSMRTLGIAGFGVGGAALAGTGLSFFLGGQEYERYLATDTSDAALESHNLLNLYSVLNIAGLVLTAAGVITGVHCPRRGTGSGGNSIRDRGGQGGDSGNKRGDVIMRKSILLPSVFSCSFNLNYLPGLHFLL